MFVLYFEPKENVTTIIQPKTAANKENKQI